jgi:hypothetical protein
MRVNFEDNFWKEFPDLIIPKEFGELYDSDTSKRKVKSSKIMWAIHLHSHPESKLYNLPDKEIVIARDFIKDKAFKWKNYQDHIALYKNVVLTPAERSLQTWDEIMALRDKGLKEFYKEALEEKDADTILKLDKALSTTPKMFDDYKRIRESYEEEKTRKKGSRISSLSDSDEI